MTVPNNWALQKPQQQIDPTLFDRMNAADLLRNLRKYNGFRAHVVTDGEATRIWSRNWSIDYTDMFPHLAAEFFDLPAGLLVDAELYVHGLDTTAAIQAAINGNGGDAEARLAVFDLLDLDGALAGRSHDDRFQLVEAMTDRLGSGVHRAQQCDAAGYAAMESLIATMGWEGVVAWDRRATHKLNTNGNVKRGESWKIKRIVTEDLLVTRIAGGTGASMVGAVLHVSRMVDGKAVPAGKIGSWSKEFICPTSCPANFVVEAQHFGIDEAGNMEFPKILRARTDLHRDFGLAA